MRTNKIAVSDDLLYCRTAPLCADIRPSSIECQVNFCARDGISSDPSNEFAAGKETHANTDFDFQGRELARGNRKFCPAGAKMDVPIWVLLFEIFERAVIRAGQFHDVPVRLELEIQLRRPRFGQRLGIFDVDIDRHVIAIDAVESLYDV